MAEMNRNCGNMGSEAQNQSVKEIEVLRYEIKFLREHMFLLITSVDSSLTFQEENMTEAGTANAEYINNSENFIITPTMCWRRGLRLHKNWIYGSLV